MQTFEREQLYRKVPPPGEPILCYVDSIKVEDAALENEELRDIVKTMQRGRATGADGMRAEDLQQRLVGMTAREEDRDPGDGNRWRHFVRLIQIIWNTGTLPQQLW